MQSPVPLCTGLVQRLVRACAACAISACAACAGLCRGLCDFSFCSMLPCAGVVRGLFGYSICVDCRRFPLCGKSLAQAFYTVFGLVRGLCARSCPLARWGFGLVLACAADCFERIFTGKPIRVAEAGPGQSYIKVVVRLYFWRLPRRNARGDSVTFQFFRPSLFPAVCPRAKCGYLV